MVPQPAQSRVQGSEAAGTLRGLSQSSSKAWPRVFAALPFTQTGQKSASDRQTKMPQRPPTQPPRHRHRRRCKADLHSSPTTRRHRPQRIAGRHRQVCVVGVRGRGGGSPVVIGCGVMASGDTGRRLRSAQRLLALDEAFQCVTLAFAVSLRCK